MEQNRYISSPAAPAERRKRRKREIFIIVIILAVVALLTFVETKLIHFGSDFPISNTILMFILININLILLLLVIFLVFRNLVKLLYDRKRNVMGSKLSTRLVVAFIAFTLLPTTVLFFFSISFITTSIQFWFNAPVEQALDNSLWLGRHLYRRTENNNKFFLEKIAYQIDTKKLLVKKRKKKLSRYIEIVQRNFNLDGIEVYTADARRLGSSKSPEIQAHEFEALSIDTLNVGPVKEKVRSISKTIAEGELRRTIGTIPFGVEHQKANAFVVAAKLIPHELSQTLSSISRGYNEYNQIKLLKRPIQITYYIILSIVALLVVFCAVWFGFYFAKSLSIPIKELAEGTLRVADGDLRFSIEKVADDELGSLVDSFNKMTQDLRHGREQIEFSSRKLRRQNIEIEQRRGYMEIVLKNISAGVISLDAAGIIKTINNSAKRMLNIDPQKVLEQSFRKLLEGRYFNLAEEVMDNVKNSTAGYVEYPLRITIDGRPRSFMLHINTLKNETGDPLGIVIVFDDLTELEKAQRIAAWREVARRIAHEVKNPLTPIALSAQRLKRRYSDRISEEVFDECTRMIIDHVELIRNLVNEFSAFARFPTISPQLCDLAQLVAETISLYKEGHPSINFTTKFPQDIPPLNLDRRQIKQALINLVDNAIAALKEKGNLEITLNKEPDLKVVRLEIGDDGEGISDEDKARLFEPNFSTKKGGMGLGLTIVSSIVMDHKGKIRVQDNHPKGAKFVVELPV